MAILPISFITEKKADLINANIYTGGIKAYAGMIVYVVGDGDNNGLYTLDSLPVTTAENWTKTGSGIVTNHANLSNLDFASSGHTGFMSDANYLPNDTVIEVASSGGDFTTLADAISFLNGKWSNGAVYINIQAGTYSMPHLLIKPVFNFGKFIIRGEGIDETILSSTANNEAILFNETNCTMYDLTIKANNADSCIRADDMSSLNIKNIKCDVKSSGIGIVSSNNSRMNINNCTLINGKFGAVASGGMVTLLGTFTVSDFTTAVMVNQGGYFQIRQVTKVFTNVTNQTSQTLGVANSNGFISGYWS